MENPKSHIFCPNCSSKNDIEQNFCRYCGLSLKDIAKSLAAQLSFNKDAAQLKQLKRLKKLEDYTAIGFTAATLAGITIFIYAVYTKMIFPGLRVFPAVVIAFMIFNFVTRQIRHLKRRRISQNDESKIKGDSLSAKETAKLIEEKPFTPAISVIENSTELLFTENKTNKLR